MIFIKYNKEKIIVTNKKFLFKIYYLSFNFSKYTFRRCNFYNNYNIKFIEGCNNQMTHLKQFDVIQNIKERYSVLSGELLEKLIPINEFIDTDNSSILNSEIA